MSDYSCYVLWGSAGHSKVLADIIKLGGGRILALFDNDQDAVTCLPGVPLFHGEMGLREWLSGHELLGVSLKAAVGIGGARGCDRQEMTQRLRAAGFSLPPLIHPAATIADTARLGEGCQILANAVVAADVSIGVAGIVNNSANVDHECRLGNGVHIAPGAVLCGCVTLADNAMIGAGAVVLPRLHIGRAAIVGAGAIVTRNVPDSTIVVGNPARILRSKR